MLITEYADIIDTRIAIYYHPNKESDKFSASFDFAEVMVNGMLLGEFGRGETPVEALRNYAKLIAGKRICFNAYSKDSRKEFNVPKNVVY